MKSQFDRAREALTLRLLNDFKQEITGNNIDRVVGHNPEEVYFVGKLMSVNDESASNSSFSSKTFIESISVDFYIDEAERNTATIRVSPRGEFYYRAYPALEEQRNAILRSVNRITGISFESFDKLLFEYKA